MSSFEGLSLEELQAQFKAVQLTESSQRLTERNCVEIIMKLIEQGELEVIYSLNGREYLTPKQLEREIQDELLQHGGRVNITELQPILNVDFSHIQRKVEDIVKKNRSIQLIEGELISNYYLDGIAEEINESLQESGETRLGDLARRFNFSTEYVQAVIERRLGKIIRGKLEGETIYTDAFVARVAARIRGAFTAITKPTPIPSILAKFDFQENLFWTVFDDLLSDGRINGNIQGRSDRAIYVPNVFAQARQAWIDSFFAQNGYMDYTTLEKLQITTPRTFLEAKYKGGVALKSVFVSPKVVSSVDGVSSEAIKADSWIDVTPMAPSILTDEDMYLLLQACPSIIQMGKNTNAVILEHHFVTSKTFLDSCVKKYDQLIKEKIEKGLIKKTDKDVSQALESKQEVDEDEDTPKKGRGGKRGAKGKGKNEEEPKSAAKGKKGGRSDTGKEEKGGADKETIEDFKKWLEDAPDEFVEAIVIHLKSSLNSIKEQALRSLFISQETKQKKNNFDDDLNTMYSNILLFQKGIAELKEDEAALEKHLLKTLCTDITNLIITNQVEYNMIDVDKNKLSTNAISVLPQLPKNVSSILEKMVQSLSGKTTEAFLKELDIVSEKLQYQLKKFDKKRERQLLLTHRQALMDQLTKESNGATAFHLVLVILYLKKHSVMVHVPGRSLSTLLNKLQPDVTEANFNLLVEFQGLVTKFLTQKQADAQVQTSLNEKLPLIKQLVLGKDDAEGKAE